MSIKLANRVTVFPGRAQGSVTLPTSKSIAHRALICAALAPPGTVSVLSAVPYNDDIDATLDCLAALGVKFDIEQENGGVTRCVRVVGCRGEWTASDRTLNCRESGSTLRFLLPLCLLSGEAHTLLGSTRLLQRPLDDYRSLFAARGMAQTSGQVTVGSGDIPSGGRFCLPGKTSSQFVTGLLHILPLLDKDSTIELEQAPESRSYIDMTLAVMRRFGVCAAWENETTIRVVGGQTYRATDMTIPGDASGAAFFHALNSWDGNVVITNDPTDCDIPQGDSICPTLLAKMENRTKGIPTISLADCPDLGPILFAVAATTPGIIFTHTARLRLKESDRIDAMATELRKFGATVLVSDDVKVIPAELSALGDGSDHGGWVYICTKTGGLGAPKGSIAGHNDHRIVMSLCALASIVGEVTIDDAYAVSKSFPTFFDCMKQLGIRIDIEK